MKAENVYDVLVVGAGVAGMYGALHFSDDTKVMTLAKYLQTSQPPFSCFPQTREISHVSQL